MGSLLQLNKYLFRYKTKLVLGISFILVSNAAGVLIPLFIKDAIDGLRTVFSNITVYDSAKVYDIVLNNGILIFIAAVVSGFFRFLIRQTIIVVSREIEYDIRQDFWTHIQRLPLRFFQNNSTGNIMAHATNDIGAVRMYVGPAVMYSIDTISTFIIVIALMITINIPLTIYTLLPLPILSFFVYKLSKRIHKKFTLIQEKFSELTTKAQESFSGIRVIKSYVKEQNEVDAFNKLSNEYLIRNMDKVKIQALFMPLLYLIAGTSVIIVIILGGSMVINGTLSLGEITAFVVFLGYLIWPTIAFGWVANIIQQADASMKRLDKIMNEKYEIEDSAKTDFSITDINGEIEFENVSFKYNDGSDYVLRNINLKIPCGSTIAIIGHTGEGKSTMVNLIARLYDIKEGTIKIDGNPINTIPLKILRKSIGLVPQETFLFSETLANNILYGVNQKDKELVKKYSSVAMLDKDVDDFPNGYDTMIGERGITLSGGQKQRTCLARALAVEPRVLILDDSFSAIDTGTEEGILKNLSSYFAGRTSILISHRISTIRNADKIIVLDKGRIVEEGLHDELVALGGIYADIHLKQLLEEELEEIN